MFPSLALLHRILRARLTARARRHARRRPRPEVEALERRWLLNGAPFAEVPSLGLTGVAFSSGALGDYDNAGDLDLLRTGRDASDTPVAKLYRNDGSDVFTEVAAGLTGVFRSSVAWGDYDNDGDLDLLLT